MLRFHARGHRVRASDNNYWLFIVLSRAPSNNYCECWRDRHTIIGIYCNNCEIFFDWKMAAVAQLTSPQTNNWLKLSSRSTLLVMITRVVSFDCQVHCHGLSCSLAASHSGNADVSQAQSPILGCQSRA